MPIITARIVNLREVQDEFRSIRRDQLPFATALALTKTAKSAQRVIQSEVLPAHFILRRASWMKANIRVEPATKQKLEASVRDTYGAMALQETGGNKIPFGNVLAVPLKGARPSPTSLIRPENMPAQVMARGGFIVGNIMYDVTLKAGRRGRIKGLFGAAQAAKWTRQIIPMYALVPRAKIAPRYGFETAVVKTVAETFESNFAAAFKQAVRTSS